MNPSKGAAEAILAAQDEGESEDKAPTVVPEPVDGDGELAAASELSSAMKKGDAKSILAAFKDLMETCGY